MKKYITTMILSLVVLGLESFAQKGQPLRPYKENGYSIAEVKALAMQNDTVAIWWRREAVRLVNNALAASGETVRVTEDHIYWILDHVTYKYRKYGSYINSHTVSGIPGWYNDSDGWEGMVGVFEFGKCSLDLYKAICTNLLNILMQLTPVIPPGTFTLKSDTTKIGNNYFVNNNYNYNNNINTISGGNSENTNINEQKGGGWLVGGQSQPQQGCVGCQQNYQPPCYNCTPQQQQQVQKFFSLGLGFNFGGGGNGGGVNPAVINPIIRTGGYGVNVPTPGSNPGLNADIRTGGPGLNWTH